MTKQRKFIQKTIVVLAFAMFAFSGKALAEAGF